jgi:hypothetical protein
MKGTALHADAVNAKELEKLTEIVSDLPADSHLGSILGVIVKSVESGRPVVLYSWDTKK